MVGFHELNIKVFATMWANALLLFVNLTTCIVIKSTDIQVMLLSIQYIRIDTSFVAHIAIFQPSALSTACPPSISSVATSW